jgi:hypothetical protein
MKIRVIVAVFTWAAMPSTRPLFGQTSSVRVQVYDYANLETATLNHFLSLTKDILSNTGISVRVNLCQGNGAMPCKSAVDARRTLMITILAGDAKHMSNSRGRALGQSSADRNGGTFGSVFLAPIRDEAGAADIPWVIVLSYATAHEVGHLLLGTQAHTSRGLMKANWDRGDYMDMFQKRCHFTQEQALLMVRRYGNDATRSSPRLGAAK